MKANIFEFVLKIIVVVTICNAKNDENDDSLEFSAPTNYKNQLVAEPIAHIPPIHTSKDLYYMEDSDSDEETNQRINQFIPQKKSYKKDVFGPRFGMNGNDVVCPDKESVCPSGTTCCLLDGDKYGCCPSPNAVCCSDKIHCCPHGTTCDTQEGICQQSSQSFEGKPSIRLLKKIPSSRIVLKEAIRTKLSRVSCEKESGISCSADSTCCFNATLGSASCCPHRNGVCCASSSTCCPKGFQCLASGECAAILRQSNFKNENDNYIYVSNQIFTAAKLLLNTSKINSRNSLIMYCDDGTECKGTCCPVRNAITKSVKSYRCCPFSEASCCGYRADVCCQRGYHCVFGNLCKSQLTNFFF